MFSSNTQLQGTLLKKKKTCSGSLSLPLTLLLLRLKSLSQSLFQSLPALIGPLTLIHCSTQICLGLGRTRTHEHTHTHTHTLT